MVGRRGRKAPGVELLAEENAELQRLAEASDVPRALARRARVVLACAGGASNREVAEALDVSEHLVGRWRTRFARGGIAEIVSAARTGARVQVELATPEGRPLASRSTILREARVTSLRPEHRPGWRLVGVHVFVSDLVLSLAEVTGTTRDASRESQAFEPAAQDGPVPDRDERLALLEARTRAQIAATTERRSALRMKRFLRDLASAASVDPLHVVVDALPSGLVRRWLDRRPGFVVHDAGTRHAWWALFDAWSPTVPASFLAALGEWLDETTHEPRAFDWWSALSGVASREEGGAS